MRTMNRSAASARITNMTEGKPFRLILTFALPLMVGNVFQQLYTVVDTAVVGQVLGVNALAALGATDWFNWMILGIIQGFAQGFSIQMAQEFGAGKYWNLNRTIGQSTVLAVIVSALLLAAAQLAARPVLILMQTPDTIMDLSLSYLRIMFAGVPVVMAYNMLASFLRALGDGRSPLYAMVVASLINVGLDLLFVAVLGFGIPGAAAATVIAQACSGLYCLHVLRHLTLGGAAPSEGGESPAFGISLSREDLTPQADQCARLMKLGLPMALGNAIIAIGGMIVQFVVNGYGVLFVAGFTATNKLYGVLEMAAISYGYSMVTYVGQNLGAGRTRRIIDGMKTALITAVLTAAVIAAVMLLFGKLILSLFISGDPQEVETTMSIAYYYLAVMSVFLPVLYILHVLRSSLQGLGDTVLPMVSGLVEFLMRTGTALLLPSLIGETGIFYAEILAWLGADVVLVLGCLYRIRRLPKAR